MAKATTRKTSPVKMCLNPECHKILPLTEFYKNRSWAEQSGCDLYCKECARKMCHDKESMRKYMWENGRAYSDEMWAAAEKRAMRTLANNAEYLSEKTSRKRKQEIKDRAICNQFFFVMNLAPYYIFSPPEDENGEIRDFDPDSLDGTIQKSADGKEFTLDSGAKIYSPTWNGLYTQQEIDYLNDYYDRLDNSFVLDDINIQDYARKVAKASLEADNRYNKMRSGTCTSKEWLEAQDTFDKMSRSSNFAASQRKDRGGAGNQVLCEIIADIEINHREDMPQVTFPPDVVDLIIADFAHTNYAIHGDMPSDES